MILSDLLGRVEGASGPDREIDLALATALVPDVVVLRRNDDNTANEPHTYWCYTEKIDDALSLVERKLPGASVNMLLVSGSCNAAVFPEGSGMMPTQVAPTLPLAILAAGLRALIQLETQGTE